MLFPMKIPGKGNNSTPDLQNWWMLKSLVLSLDGKREKDDAWTVGISTERRKGIRI